MPASVQFLNNIDRLVRPLQHAWRVVKIRSVKRGTILLLQGTSGHGGSKGALVDLAVLLREIGYRPVVLCGQTGGATSELDRREIEWARVYFPAWRKLWGRAVFRPVLCWNWLPLARRFNAAIVHSNEFWWAPHAVALSRRLGIPAIVTLHAGTHEPHKARQYDLQHTHTLIAVSSDVKKRFSRDPLLWSKTIVQWQGFPDQPDASAQERAAARQEFGFQPQELVIGNAGRLCENKNQILLIRALADIQSDPALPRCKLLLAGTSDTAYARLLRRETERLGLTEQVHIAGWLQPLRPFWAAIDVLAHCSRSEGLPRVVVEGMLAGKPVIATATEGISDVIADERSGVVVPIDNRRALAEALVHLLTHEAARKELGQSGRQAATSRFGWESWRRRVEEFYHSVIQSPSHERPSA